MILIIPAIDLREGLCVRRTGKEFSVEQTFFDDPVNMARLWRVQNAKLLHVSSQNLGGQVSASVISGICDAVDIPVQLHANFRSAEDVKLAFDSGLGRAVVDVVSMDHLDFFNDLLTEFGSSRVVAGIRGIGGFIHDNKNTTAIQMAGQLEAMNCRRIVYTEAEGISSPGTFNLQTICDLAESLSRIRLTIGGGISGYEDLRQLSLLGSRKIDSAIIGRALYENRFPCQQFWCWNQKDSVDLSRFSTAKWADRKG